MTYSTRRRSVGGEAGYRDVLLVNAGGPGIVSRPQRTCCCSDQTAALWGVPFNPHRIGDFSSVRICITGHAWRNACFQLSENRVRENDEPLGKGTNRKKATIGQASEDCGEQIPDGLSQQTMPDPL
jgi:hypothetical protein